MSLTISPINQNSPSFNRRAGLKYTEIKYLPKLSCACCGRDLITGPEAHHFYTSITKPLKLMVEKGHFKAWQYSPRVWDVLSNFVANFPEKSLDQIIKNEENQKALKKALVVDLKEKVANGTRDFKNEMIPLLLFKAFRI